MRRVSFKLIPGFERYRIYSDGRVYDSKRKKFCKLTHTSFGYLSVRIKSSEGFWNGFQVHRLVAQAFCYNNDPEHKVEVDHIDTVRDHNEAFNLRWVTLKENRNNPLTREHMSVAMSGENHPLYGTHRSEETKAKQSASMKGKLAGENHPFYGKPTWNKGKKTGPRSEAVKIKCSPKKYRNKLDGRITTSSRITVLIKQGKTTEDQWELIQSCS